MADKTPNYTPEQTARILELYAAGTDTAEIAAEFGKTQRSVVAKLSREGVYQKKAYVTKTGEPVRKKDQTADAIGAILNMTEAETESLTKANRGALGKIFAALANSVPANPSRPAVDGSKSDAATMVGAALALTAAEAASLAKANRSAIDKINSAV